MKQTAVEFLLSHMWTTDWVNYTREQKLNVIQQAKAMEKEQSIKEMIGLLKWMNKIASETPMRLETDLDDIVEQYYNETYGQGSNDTTSPNN